MKLRRHENNVLAWRGDAALLYVARLVLTEIYPTDMPIKLLMERQERVVSNDSLNAYCKRLNLTHGCNVMEIKIGEMVIGNQLEEAKNVVRNILQNDKVIKRMDTEQLDNVDGKIQLKETFIKNYLYHEKIRTEKTRIFNKLHKSTLIHPIVKRCGSLMPYLNKFVNFLLVVKYKLIPVS
jgi:hypothetical protein